MKIKIPGRHNNEYFVVIAHTSLKKPISIMFHIDCWEKYDTGPLSKCEWATNDGKGYHRGSICTRFYREGKIEWSSDDGKEDKPGLPLCVMNGIEDFCKRILRLKMFL